MSRRSGSGSAVSSSGSGKPSPPAGPSTRTPTTPTGGSTSPPRPRPASWRPATRSRPYRRTGTGRRPTRKAAVDSVRWPNASASPRRTSTSCWSLSPRTSTPGSSGCTATSTTTSPAAGPPSAWPWNSAGCPPPAPAASGSPRPRRSSRAACWRPPTPNVLCSHACCACPTGSPRISSATTRPTAGCAGSSGRTPAPRSRTGGPRSPGSRPPSVPAAVWSTCSTGAATRTASRSTPCAPRAGARSSSTSPRSPPPPNQPRSSGRWRWKPASVGPGWSSARSKRSPPNVPREPGCSPPCARRSAPRPSSRTGRRTGIRCGPRRARCPSPSRRPAPTAWRGSGGGRSPKRAVRSACPPRTPPPTTR